MSIDLNIEDGSKSANPEFKPSTPAEKKPFLEKLSTKDIARVFADEDSTFIKDKRVLVVPIGFPQAGKSLLLSSLLYYARVGDEKNSIPMPFKSNVINQWPFDKGRIANDEMIRSFTKKKELYAGTQKGTLDLIGIDIHPVKNLPYLPVAFLDLAGEDIKGIKTSEGSAFTDKINAVFNGIKLDGSPVVFLLITPFDPARKDNESSKDAHAREDTLHYDFLNFMDMEQSQLVQNAKFFVIVSQWDKNTDKNLDVETFIREKRPSIYQYVKNSTVVWGEYSIGKLLETEMEDEKGNKYIDQELKRINYEYPSRFWKKLYQICTNKNLDQKSFWEKIFG